MSAVLVHPQDRPLVGSVPVPSDDGIAMRALLLAGLCEGESELRGVTGGAGTRAMERALRALGVAVEESEKGIVRVTGKGLFGLSAPSGPLDCGSSPSALGLLAGALAAQPFATRLEGDARVARAALRAVVDTLAARGGRLRAEPHPTASGELAAPLEIDGLAADESLRELEVESPSLDPEVKGALLVSGLFAHGTTWFKEPAVTRDHTERRLHALGAPLRTLGTMVELDPAGWDGVMKGFAMAIPGDATAAAYLVVAAQAHAGSRVTVRRVGTNPTRTGLVEIARQMGAGVEIAPLGDEGGEPVGDLVAWHGAAHGVAVGGELLARAQGEIPALAALAARARGTTTVRDVRESEARGDGVLAGTARLLGAFGVRCERLPDGLVIEGHQGPLEPAVFETGGDGGLAMAAVLLGLGGKAPSRIVDCDAIAEVFPRFIGTLRALGARLDVET